MATRACPRNSKANTDSSVDTDRGGVVESGRGGRKAAPLRLWTIPTFVLDPGQGSGHD